MRRKFRPKFNKFGNKLTRKLRNFRKSIKTKETQ